MFRISRPALSAILRRHAKAMSIRTDDPGHLYVELAPAEPKAKPSFFGAVQAKKSYVSYHLMPVYEDPGLLDGISPGLRKQSTTSTGSGMAATLGYQRCPSTSV